jgi:hypothetical protein
MATRPAASVIGKPQAVSRLVSRKAGSRPAGGLRAVRLATSASEQPTDNERKVHQNLVHQLLERVCPHHTTAHPFSTDQSFRHDAHDVSNNGVSILQSTRLAVFLFERQHACLKHSWKRVADKVAVLNGIYMLYVVFLRSGSSRQRPLALSIPAFPRQLRPTSNYLSSCRSWQHGNWRAAPHRPNSVFRQYSTAAGPY